MPGRARKRTYQDSLFDAKIKTAPCVPKLQEEVKKWASGPKRYEGVTETTKILLEYWFHSDLVRRDGRRFNYYNCQKEAVETIVYLYEIAKAPLVKDLVERYAPGYGHLLRLPQYDDFPRYCLKMATGSGKTVVMTLIIAWQYLNAMAEGSDDYAKTFLILAPNVIVLERLKKDFAGGIAFKSLPVIPKELEIYWGDFDFYVRGDSEKPRSSGALFLTNIQQFYERSEKTNDEPSPMTGVLGNKPPAEFFTPSQFDEIIIKRKERCLVINDEAHHTHDDELRWNEFIRALNDRLPRPLVGQLDFTATPRYQKGELFTWTVYDYPLKQAIIDNIVKRPIKGIATGFKELKSNKASRKYEPYLIASVERWKEYKEQLATFGKKPVLFIMMNSTKEADDVGNWLRVKYPDLFGGKQTLVIHTDTKGEVSKKDLEEAREIARNVDDEDSKVNAIVSVLMLREGWDVKNVTVILGLRPYSSKANILPEQTVGRGLRKMFNEFPITGYVERVDVIGNSAFLKFVEELEKEEEIPLETFRIGKDRLNIPAIFVDKNKLDKNISLPQLTPTIERKGSIASEISAIDVSEMKLSKPFPTGIDDNEAKTFNYEGYDILTLEKLFEKKYEIPEPRIPEEVIGYYAELIAEEIKLPSMFSYIAPKVKEFLENIFFGKKVNLNEEKYLKAICRDAAQYIILDRFRKVLKPIVIEEKEPRLKSTGINLSDTKPFPYSRPTCESKKCIFNLVPCANEFEKEIAMFFDRAKDVERFSSLPEQVGFSIVYTDSANNIRYYYPDFVVVTTDGKHYIVEAKGLEDIDVRFKDQAAERWCENASKLTRTEWRYVKISQNTFNTKDFRKFEDLVIIWEETKRQE